MSRNTPPSVPALAPRRGGIELLDAPTKEQTAALIQAIANDPDYKTTKKVYDAIIDHFDKYRDNPDLQIAQVAGVMDAINQYAKQHDLNRGVLLLSDAPCASDTVLPSAIQPATIPMDGFVMLDNGGGLVNIPRPTVPPEQSVRHQMYDEVTLRALNIVAGDGTSELTPRIVGSRGIEVLSAANISFMPGWDRDKMTQLKRDFVQDVSRQVWYIDQQGSKKFCRIHPWTVIQWAESLYGALDTTGWKTLRHICHKATTKHDSGAMAAAALTTQQLAAKETEPNLKLFYFYLAQSVQMDTKKDEFWYLLKAYTDFHVYEVYHKVLAEMRDTGSAIRQRINQFEQERYGGLVRGRGSADRVKTYLSFNTGTSANAFTRHIVAGKPMKMIVDRLGPGFLMLLPYSELRSLNKMVVGTAESLINRFYQDMIPVDYDPQRDGPQGVLAATEKIYHRITRPMLDGQFAKIHQFRFKAPQVNDSFMELIDSQLVALDADVEVDR